MHLISRIGLGCCVVGVLVLGMAIIGGGGWGPCGPVHEWALFALMGGVLSFGIGGLLVLFTLALRLLRRLAPDVSTPTASPKS